MAGLSFSLFLVLALFSTSLCADIKAIFGPSLSNGAEILLPSDANYTTNLTQRWDKFAEPQYTAAIKPATEQDVSEIVLHAKVAFPSSFHEG